MRGSQWTGEGSGEGQRIILLLEDLSEDSRAFVGSQGGRCYVFGTLGMMYGGGINYLWFNFHGISFSDYRRKVMRLEGMNTSLLASVVR